MKQLWPDEITNFFYERFVDQIKHASSVETKIRGNDNTVQIEKPTLIMGAVILAGAMGNMRLVNKLGDLMAADIKEKVGASKFDDIVDSAKNIVSTLNRPN